MKERGKARNNTSMNCTFATFETDAQAADAARKIVESLPPGGKFVDPVFGEHSLALSDLLYHDSSIVPDGAIPPELVKWGRISTRAEIRSCASPVLFPPPHAFWGPLLQGRLANQWMLNGLALLIGSETGREQLSSCFVSSEFGLSHGLFMLRFWKEGRWVYVTIDDRIPCDIFGNPLFSHSADRNTVWLMVLEKAYAKLHGSYLNLEDGQAADFLVDITGGTVDYLPFNWTLLEQSFATKSPNRLLGAFAKAPQQGKTRSNRGGIMCGRTYAIHACFEPVEGTRLIKLTDYWAKTMWRGKWSSVDPCWRDPANEAVKEAVNPDDEWDKHVVFMSWEDAKEIFTDLLCCSLCNPRSRFSETWKHTLFSGSFEEENIYSGGGGSPNTMFEWLQNPMVSFTVETSCKLCVLFRQPQDPRLHDFFELKSDRGFLRSDKQGPDRLDTSGKGVAVCKVGKYRCGKHRVDLLTSDQLLASSGSQYRNARQVCCSFVDLPRGDYAIVPSTFEGNVFGNFVLDVFHSGSVEFHYRPEDNLAQAMITLGSKKTTAEEDDAVDDQNTGANPLPKFLGDNDPFEKDDMTTRQSLELEAIQRQVALAAHE